jgi:hypothetical protein
MYEIGIARAGLLRVPATPELAYEFMEVRPRKIWHYGVDVDGLRYDGEGLDGLRYTDSPYGGRLAGLWPIRVNPDDVRYAYFYNPERKKWFRLVWEHAAGLGTPFSAEAAKYARKLTAENDRWPDEVSALKDLLARWDKGVVAGRRERRMAARLAAEYQALAAPEQEAGTAGQPDCSGPRTPDAGEPPEPGSGDDERREPSAGYYDQAFEVLP